MASRLGDISDAGGSLSALPTEIWYYVLRFLDSGDKMMFARCSWLCFFIAFPNGVKLPEETNQWSLQPFADGGRLAAFRDRIRWARFDIIYPKAPGALFQKVIMFPNLCRLEINIVAPSYINRKIFDALFCLLSTLPYYDNIKHLTLGWHSSGWGPVLGELEDPEQKFLNALHPAIGPRKTLDKINFPLSLRSLRLCMAVTDCLMPLINYERITSLTLCYPVNTMNFEFRNIKTLTVDSQYPIPRLNLGVLPTQFPCVETFSLLRTRPGSPDESWVQHVPKFQKIINLVLSWPQVDCKNVGIDVLETTLETMLSTSTDLRTLQTVRFCGFRDFSDHRRNIEATCRISVAKEAKPGKMWDFKWEGNISNYQDDLDFFTGLLADESGDEWEEGKTDDEADDIDEEDLGSEEEDEYDDQYFEYLAEDDDLYVNESDEESPAHQRPKIFAK
ncbi:hypothetical protein TWF281_010407 [Arthrobotrys megalospora]